jgi:hypothetical protein
MKQKLLSGLVFVTVMAATMTFQNCGTYQPSDNADFMSLQACTGSQCLISPESIQLSIQNPDQIILRKAAPAETEVDIGGFCDSGGYPVTEIRWALLDTRPNGGTVQLGSGGACDQLGRFQFKVPYPSTFSTVPEGLELQVALYGKDGNQMVINPRALHYQVRRLMQQ